jgi:hypothetical protein
MAAPLRNKPGDGTARASGTCRKGVGHAADDTESR